MKRRTEHKFETYSSITLYLDDIEKIIDIMSKYGEVEVSTSDFEYENYKEFISANSKKDSIYSLSIWVHRPNISFTVDKSSARLSADGDVEGEFYLIDNILKKSMRSFHFLRIGFVWYSFFMLFFIIPSITVSLIEKNYIEIITKDNLYTFLTYYFYVLVAWLAFWCFDTYVLKKAVVRMTHRGVQKNFFIRNSDLLFATLISTIVGAVIGAFALYLFQQYF